MKLLHTSDWHLGKKLGRIARIDEQRIVLDEICLLADTHAADAIVVAGDVFDTFNPPTDAIELFYSTLKKLSHRARRPVIVIAGNHDSPDRIEAPNPLARDNGIIFIGYPKTRYASSPSHLPFSISASDESFIEICFENKEKLRILTAPFANEYRMQQAFENNKDQALVEHLEVFWQSIASKYCNTEGVNILLGHHLFLPNQGLPLEEPDDEKPIQAISALIPISAIPKEIQYVALGHLHRFQTISTQPHIIYSGSPLAYSFSEAMQTKSVAIVTLLPGIPAQVEKINLSTPKVLVRKTCKSILAAIEWLEKNQDCYVELTIVSDTFFSPAEIKSLYACHQGIITIIPQVSITHDTQNQINIPQNTDKSMLELFEEFFMQKHNGQKPNNEIKDLFLRIVASEQ